MSRLPKVPQIMQMEALECGAASLSMILAYYGRWVPLEQARADCGVSRDGSKAANVLKAARAYGLKASGRMMSSEALAKRDKFPVVVFWNFNHFLVVRGHKRGKWYLNDPGGGQIAVADEAFEESFTGIVLDFEPTEEFEPGGAKPNTRGFLKSRLEGMGGALAFIMVTAALISGLGILSTALSTVFIDQVLSGSNRDWLMPLIALMIFLALGSGLVSALNAVAMLKVQGKTAVLSSSRFMRHLLHLPVGFYAQRMVGDLQQRQASNEQIASRLIGELAPVLVNSAMLVLYLGVMLRYSVPLSLIGIGAVVLNAFVARRISAKRINVARSNAIAMGRQHATAVGGVEMIETIKSAGAESGYFRRWAGFQANANDGMVRTAKINAYLGSIPALLVELANTAVLALGVWLIVTGSFTVGSLLAFQGLLAAFTMPVQQIIGLGQTIQELTTEVERVEDVMRYEPDIPTAGEDDASGEDERGEAGTDAAGAEAEEAEDDPFAALDLFAGAGGSGAFAGKDRLGGAVELRNLTFGYSPLEEPVVKEFSLKIEPGQWVALVGPSGCGKSTISKLVAGLYKPWSGEVLFDGVPMAEVPRPILRGSLAVVDQDIVTFVDSVAENVRLWDRSIEDFEVIMACRDAEIHDTIAAREGGYGARIAPGGRNFSGGQLQRLEIARVLAMDPTIVILDEATSALDAETEEKVIQRIRDRGITCIVVAHRLSTIRDCDEIVVLDKGVVVERGTHSELLANDGHYAELVRSS